MKKIFTIALIAILIFNMSEFAFSASFDKYEFEEKYKELANLISECEKRGINVDKEKVNASVINKFIDNVDFDAVLDENLQKEGTSLKKLTGRSLSQSVLELNDLYYEAKKNLNAYINDEQRPNVPSFGYSTGSMIIDDEGIKVGDSPFYSVGYGHFGTVQKDIALFKDLGTDNIAIEIGPNSILELMDKPAQKYINNGELCNKTAVSLQKVLKTAAESDVGVNLLLSPHYLPKWCMDMYSDLNTAKAGWCQYNIFTDNAKKLISEYLAGILPKIADYPSLNTIILSNEPTCVTYLYPDAFTTDFRLYLLNKHKTVAVLNEAWGTDYTKFSEIKMPQYDASTGLPLVYDACFYDWYIYNDEKLTGWHEWMANEVRKHIPNAKISVKVLDYLWMDDNVNTYRLRGITGNDVERMAEFCDLAGIDAHGNISDYPQIIDKYKWYDYVRSVTGQPIYNSEDHIFYDGYNVFGDRVSYQDKHAAAGIWEGALHGCEMTSLWTWERLNYTPSGGETWIEAVKRELNTPYSAALLHRPKVVAAIGKQAVNLRRLNDEVRILEKSKNNAAIMYSKSSRVYNLDYMKSLQEVYETMISIGIGADFVTEYKPERMFDYDIMILPEMDNIESNTLRVLAEFCNNGGKIILLNSTLAGNEYNRESNDKYLEEIIKSSVSIENDMAALKSILVSEDKRPIKLTLTNSNGEFVTGVDFKWTQNDDGSVLASICNLSNSDIKNLTIYLNGEAVLAEDMISGAQVGENFTAKRYDPILIYIQGSGGLLKNITVHNAANDYKLIKWRRELGPVYVYSVNNGMENKRFTGIGYNKFYAKDGDIYYLQKSDKGIVYPGQIISFQNETVFNISEKENGFIIKNISDSYAAGVVVISYDKNGVMSEMSMQSLFMAPGEEIAVGANSGTSASVYNNLFEWRKISN